MAWFGRRRSATAVPAPGGGPGRPAEPAPRTLPDVDGTLDERPPRPLVAPVGDVERDRIAAALAALAAEGVDVDDLAALGAGYDAAFAAWRTRGGGHERVVERYAIGVGEYLARHSTLDWHIVTDSFGTDLGLAGGPRGDFVVVPKNLVAARWMRRETGWVPGVLGHLTRRSER